MYSLGGLRVSSDDDMRPYSLMEDSPESLENNEISRGRLHKLGKNGYVRKSFDMVSAFFDVLGKPVSEVLKTMNEGNSWSIPPWIWKRTHPRDLQTTTP
jgi:hypothetical protein